MLIPYLLVMTLSTGVDTKLPSIGRLPVSLHGRYDPPHLYVQTGDAIHYVPTLTPQLHWTSS